MAKNGSDKRKITAIKAAGLVILAGACVILVLKFSDANTVPAFSQNDKLATTVSPVYTAAPAPSAHIEQSQQPIQTDNSAPETALTIKEVRTGEKQPLLPLDDIDDMYKLYGSMTIEGMKPEDYDKAMAIEWETVNTPGEPEDLSIDLSELMDYEAFENYILNLDRYEGVEVSVIGKSEQGRNIYMVNVDLADEQEPAKNKRIIMMTGSVHAREFAGAEYMVKFLNDTIKKAAYDPYTRLLLENVTIVAVPLVNPDGREMIIEGGDGDRKSNANGVDLNRAMPSVNAGQLASEVELHEDFSKRPGLDFFAGNNLGTESETQAMIKWFNYYVPIAYLYIDLHQQGGIEYFNKRFVSRESDLLSENFAAMTNDLLRGGYPLRPENVSYGFNGDGGTLTDYARSVSEGMIYSYSLGRMVLDSDNIETPLICFKDIDDDMKYYKPLNDNFRSICIEIGRKPNFLGADEKARQNRNDEYFRYGWFDFLTGTIENVLGEEKADALMQQANGR